MDQGSLLLQHVCPGCQNLEQLERAIAEKIESEGADVIPVIFRYMELDYQSEMLSLEEIVQILNSFMDENSILPAPPPKGLEYPILYTKVLRNINLSGDSASEVVKPETRKIILDLLEKEYIESPERMGNIVATYVEKFSISDILQLDNGWELLTFPETFIYLSPEEQKEVFLALMTDPPDNPDIVTDNLSLASFPYRVFINAINEAIVRDIDPRRIITFFYYLNGNPISVEEGAKILRDHLSQLDANGYRDEIFEIDTGILGDLSYF